MATITKPMALDESFNTTESTSRNQADVLVGIEQAIVRGFGQVADAVAYDNTDSGLTADNVQDAIDEVDDTVDGLVDDVAEISSDIESTQTVSGNPITLTDAAPINAESLVVEFEPIQEGSGDPSPTNIRPITGYDECEVDDVGKNQIPMTLSKLKELNTSGTWSGNAYTINGVTFTIQTDDGGNVTKIETSGTTSESIYHFVIGEDIVLNGNYKFTSGNTNPWSGYNYLCLAIDSNNTEYIPTSNDGVALPSGTYKVVIGIALNTNVDGKAFYPMIRDATDTDSSFVPYHSSNATIQFGQTVYGGKSNFTEGGTDSTYGYDADLGAAGRPWWAEGDGVFRTELLSSKFKGRLYCSMYKGVQKDWPDDGEITVTNSQVYQLLRIKDTTCAGYTAPEFAAHISGCQLAYELATPTQLSTPPSPLKLLKGTNHINTNGTTINLGYQPDNVIGELKGEIEKCAVDAEFAQFTDGNDTFTDVNLTLDGYSHTVSMVGSKIEQKRFICFEVAEIRSGSVQGIHASCIAFADGAKTPSGTAFRAYIESLQMYVDFRIYGSGGSYTLAYQSESSFSASAFFVRVRMMNNL